MFPPSFNSSQCAFTTASSFAFSGFHFSKYEQIAFAMIPSELPRIAKCFSLAAKKHSLVLFVISSSSIPKIYFALSHRKFEFTPKDLVTISGTLNRTGTHTFFFPRSSSVFSEIMVFIVPSSFSSIA